MANELCFIFAQPSKIGGYGKVVRGFMETRHDRLGREKIVVSGTDGSVRRHKGYYHDLGRFLGREAFSFYEKRYSKHKNRSIMTA